MEQIRAVVNIEDPIQNFNRITVTVILIVDF